MIDTDKQNLIDRLFAAGAHFGFSKSRRHPSITQYVFGTKHGVDIIDLERSSDLIGIAADYMKKLGTEGKTVLFIGTKEEISDLVEKEAKALSMPYVTNRWIGGIITNLTEIKRRTARLIDLKDKRDSGELERKYTKKERLMLTREADKLEYNFGGIAAMERAPDAVLIVDVRHEAIAAKEAMKAGVPVIAIASSDSNIKGIAKPVIVNDAHRASVALALSELGKGYREGRESYVEKPKKSANREEVRAQ